MKIDKAKETDQSLALLIFVIGWAACRQSQPGHKSTMTVLFFSLFLSV